MPASPRPGLIQPTDEERTRATTATAAAATATAATDAVSFAARKQLQDKAQSLLRGLEHVQRCAAGDACGRALCHSTKRLLRTYATHECARRSSPAADCRVCRLWQFLLAEKRRNMDATTAAASAAAVDDASGASMRPLPPVVRPVCGLSALARRLATRSAPISIRRRVLVAAREAAASHRL